MVPRPPYRRSNRLAEFDYATEGSYFVTICSHRSECVFGTVNGADVILNETGGIVADCWMNVRLRFPSVKMDTFVIMPNHLHCIVVLEDVGAGFPRPGAETAPLQPPKLGRVIAFLKYASTKRINEARQAPGARVWQRNYYDHVIRDENDLRRARGYILKNPLKWHLDRYHPSSVPASAADQHATAGLV